MSIEPLAICVFSCVFVWAQLHVSSNIYPSTQRAHSNITTTTHLNSNSLTYKFKFIPWMALFTDDGSILSPLFAPTQYTTNRMSFRNQQSWFELFIYLYCTNARIKKDTHTHTVDKHNTQINTSDGYFVSIVCPHPIRYQIKYYSSYNIYSVRR